MENEEQQEIEEKSSSTPTNVAKIDTEKKEQQIDLKTIMPTMVDLEEDDKAERKQDISAIIPKNVQEIKEGENLVSKEEELKSDGSIVLGRIEGEGIAMSENAKLPEPIDVEARIKEARAIREGKKRQTKVRDVNSAKKEMKNLNKKTLLAILLIAILAGCFYKIKQNPTQTEFRTIPVVIELGDKLPIHSSSYVTPATGQTVDDLTYRVDTSKVKIDVVGEYEFTVSHGGMIKLGILTVKDTTPPDFIVKELVITEGTSYDAPDFVTECFDLSGCDFSFEEEGINERITNPGDYEINIASTDIYGNKSEKKAKLRIEKRGNVKYFIKTQPFDETTGYEYTETIELHFSNIADTAIILNGTRTKTYSYNDQEIYQKARHDNYGMENTTVDDEQMIITIKEPANTIGDNARYEYVMNYLNQHGYIETDSDYNPI